MKLEASATLVISYSWFMLMVLEYGVLLGKAAHLLWDTGHNQPLFKLSGERVWPWLAVQQTSRRYTSVP